MHAPVACGGGITANKVLQAFPANRAVAACQRPLPTGAKWNSLDPQPPSDAAKSARYSGPLFNARR